MKNKSRNPDPAAELQSQDAVTLLKADHLRVKRLFAQFDALKEGGSDDAKSRIAAQICLELTIHTALEEEIFYPAVRETIDDGDQMDEAVVEHAGAKQLIAQLRRAEPDDPLYDAKVTVLSEQIDHHVTEEEGSMFPKASHAQLDLEALGEKMLARKSELQGDPSLLDTLESAIVGTDDGEKATPPARSRAGESRKPSPKPIKPAVKKTPKKSTAKKR